MSLQKFTLNRGSERENFDSALREKLVLLTGEREKFPFCTNTCVQTLATLSENFTLIGNSEPFETTKTKFAPIGATGVLHRLTEMV